jgi:hypothetical protein
MPLIKYFAKSVNLLNLLLGALIVIFAYRTASPFLRTNVALNPPPPPRPITENKAETPPAQVPSPNDYTIVGEQNLFHPLRLIPVDKPVAPPLPKPEFVLSGTLVAGDLSVAYLEDKKAPLSTPGRGKRQMAVRRGEAMSGFVLRDVAPDRVVMVRGEETITVLLNDATKTREVVTTAQPPGQQPVPGQQAAGGQPTTLPGIFSSIQQGAAAVAGQTPPAGAQPTPAPAASSRIRRRTGPVNYNVD